MIDRETCPRCGGRMAFAGREEMQLGQYGLFTGPWSQLLSGALAVEIYCCQGCGRLEFYAAEPPEEAGAIAQTACPACGALHDCDDAKCPRCGERLF